MIGFNHYLRVPEQQDEPTLRAGFARASISPRQSLLERGVSLQGYAVRPGLAHSVHDELFVSSLLLVQGGQRALLVSLDTCELTSSQARMLEEALAKVAGVPAAHVVLNASHTHSGPDPAYLPYWHEVVSRATEAAEQAVAACAPVRSFRSGRAPCDIGYNRRVKVDGMPPGEERSMTIGVNESGPTLGYIDVWEFQIASGSGATPDEQRGDDQPAKRARGGGHRVLMVSGAAHGCVLPPENCQVKSASHEPSASKRSSGGSCGAGCGPSV